ncbi:phage recombination protein Bet [Streptomyces sp. NPDC094447]|uniref:phage recombination protein Bet n=1 Tax=Streptomyces sp. NPDC094447 TaxID=3366062 RepID=UPI0038155612
MTDLATTTGGSLAIQPDQAMWSPEQRAVLAQSGIDNDVTNAELASFLHLCQRTQLDPFSRQIYLIGRWDRKQNRKVFTPQTGIDGYRVVAHRVVTQTGQAFGYEDTIWCDQSGQWNDVWLSDQPPAAAKVTVLRNGQRFSAVALFQEYVQTNRDGARTGMWAKMAANQIAKCAEALALRKAFPHDLAGVYTAEEMAQADQPQEERHLRSVRQDEPDPWATAGPQRDFLAEAETAADVDAVRQIWREAKQAGMPAPVLNGIVEISKLKAANREPEPEVVEGVVVEDVELPTDDHAAAVSAYRAFTAEHGITETDADQQAYTALGAPLADVSAKAIWDLLSQLTAA